MTAFALDMTGIMVEGSVGRVEADSVRKALQKFFESRGCNSDLIPVQFFSSGATKQPAGEKGSKIMTKANDTDTALTIFTTTADGDRRIVAATTKKAAREALKMSEWIARKGLAVSTDSQDAKIANKTPGHVFTVTADAVVEDIPAGEVLSMATFTKKRDAKAGADPKPVKAAKPAPKATAAKPKAKRISSVHTLTAILDALGDALADESELSRMGCDKYGKFLLARGFVEDADVAASAIWDRLQTTALPNRRRVNDMIEWSQHDRYQEARACIDRVYEVTDRIECADKAAENRDRIPAWNYCMGCLVGRFAAGNFKAPGAHIVARWITRAGFPAPAKVVKAA